MRIDLLRHGDLLAVLAAAAMSGSAIAQAPAGYSSGFETLAAAPGGTQLWDPVQPAGTLGQDNYYWPAGTTSVPFFAYTYAGNTLGVPAHPTGGGNVFIAGNGPAGGSFARAQRDCSYGFNTGRWTIGSDLLVQFNGTLPTAQNVGSLSVQPFPGGKSFIMLLTWTDVATAATWNADYVWFNAAGTQQQASPGAAFQGNPVNAWFRWETDVNLTTNEILEVRLTNLTAGTTVSANPVGQYMFGGAAGSAVPTGFRFFAGGGVAGNTIAWDNVSVRAGKVSSLPPNPCPTPCCWPANTFRVSGLAQLGGAVTFAVDYVTPGVNPGALAAVGISLTAGINPPCGIPLPGVVNNVLIGLPAGTAVLSLSPWAGAGSPVLIPFGMPPNIAGFSPYIGLSLYTQGAFLDVVAGQVVLTQGAEIILGG